MNPKTALGPIQALANDRFCLRRLTSIDRGWDWSAFSSLSSSHYWIVLPPCHVAIFLSVWRGSHSFGLRGDTGSDLRQCLLSLSQRRNTSAALADRSDIMGFLCGRRLAQKGCAIRPVGWALTFSLICSLTRTPIPRFHELRHIFGSKCLLEIGGFFLMGAWSNSWSAPMTGIGRIIGLNRIWMHTQVSTIFGFSSQCVLWRPGVCFSVSVGYGSHFGGFAVKFSGGPNIRRCNVAGFFMLRGLEPITTTCIFGCIIRFRLSYSGGLGM